MLRKLVLLLVLLFREAIESVVVARGVYLPEFKDPVRGKVES